MHLPGLVGERLYFLFDKTGKGHITKEEFLSGCKVLISCKFEDRLQLVFDMLDFDGDHKVEGADIWTLVSNVPLQKAVSTCQKTCRPTQLTRRPIPELE
jgi:hypothetical protein